MSDKNDTRGGAQRVAPQNEPAPAAPAAIATVPAPALQAVPIAAETKVDPKADPNFQKRLDAAAEHEKAVEEGTVDDTFVVAPGKAITSQIGIIEEGQAVEAKYFQLGDADFQRLKDAGFIVRKGK